MSLASNLFFFLVISFFVAQELNATKDYSAMDPQDATKVLLKKEMIYKTYKEEAKGLLANLKKNKAHSNDRIEDKIKATQKIFSKAYIWRLPYILNPEEELTYKKIVNILKKLIDFFSAKAEKQISKLTKNPNSQINFQKSDWAKAYHALWVLKELSIDAEGSMDGKMLSQLASANGASCVELSPIENMSSEGKRGIERGKFLDALKRPSLIDFLEKRAEQSFVK